jgi:hypothetical protein
MLERDIEKKVKDYARSKGWLAYKFTSPGHAFVPDGILISPRGEVIFIEFKQLGKKATAGQLREHERMMLHGAAVFIVDNVEYGKELIDAYR